LPLEHITEAAMVSKLVTCMSNQEVAKRILLDHENWQDAKEMDIRDDDAAFVLKKMQMRSRSQINSLSLDDNARRKTCRFHNTQRGAQVRVAGAQATRRSQWPVPHPDGPDGGHPDPIKRACLSLVM